MAVGAVGAVGAVVVGAAYGAATGLVLVWLLRQPPEAVDDLGQEATV